MISQTFKHSALFVTSIMMLQSIAPSATAQNNRLPRDEAVLVVDGSVREIFRSPRQGQVDLLVEVLVEEAELGRNARNRGRVIIPAEGESIYVHLSELPDQIGHARPPAERSQVRVFLYPRPQGGWQGAFPDWFELRNNTPVAAGPNDPLPPLVDRREVAADRNRPTETAPASASAFEMLGIEGQAINAGGSRIVVQINEVKTSSPAAKAGFEVGDVIIGVAKTPLTGLDQFTDLLRKNAPEASVLVFDKNTNQATSVNVSLGRIEAGDRPGQPNIAVEDREMPGPVRRRAGRVDRIGAELEAVEADRQIAWKVVALQAGGPAEIAGFEVGDLITGLNNRPIGDLDALNQSLAGTQGNATFMVRDSRSGRSIPVDVVLGSGRMTEPATNRTSPAGSNAPLGVVVESVDIQEIPSLRISRVEPGSAADRAGLKAGDIVESVNDTIVFNPNDFSVVVGESKGNVVFKIRDRGGRRSTVKVP